MTSGAECWEERYSRSGYHAGTEPAHFLIEVCPRLPPGLAVDLAMGGGRNAVFLAGKGWRVIGIERSRTALQKAAELSQFRGLPVSSPENPELEFTDGPPGLVLLEADLGCLNLPADRFDVVICFNYLQRSLFDCLERSLRSGGMLVYETHTVEQLRFSSGPRNPDHLLLPGELREAFPDLELLLYRETSEGKGRASLLGRKR
ncbi:MAG: class I SAM-dependent methyltransferase [Acidobacteria bacterium]|nr:class I SAM-dependent methyltransferase [Acidobacteriota bacterium]